MSDTAREARPTSRGGRTGVVTSTGGEKTIRVVVNSLVKNPVYGKYVRRRTKLAVHDPGGVAHLGDLVEIAPCRRMSKTKAWRLVRIVRSADAALRDSAGEG
jgi:small subunit ribosomal protein S17